MTTRRLTRMLVEMLYIGDRLRGLRKRGLLTQEQLAKRSGVGVATITRVERNQVEPQAGTLRKLAEALGVEVRDFFPDARAVSLEQWLEERCGHAYLAGSFEELRRFIEDAEDLDAQVERRQLLREEIDAVVAERVKFPATEPRNIAGVPFEEIHTRWIRTLLVSVKLRIVSLEEAEREVEELVLA
jgi:transcriptional regulator with XRE-family HTH domain